MSSNLNYILIGIFKAKNNFLRKNFFNHNIFCCYFNKMDDSPGKSENYPHASLYKIKNSNMSQEERRMKLLEEQKEKRHEEMDKNRPIEEFLEQFEDVDETEDMDCEYDEGKYRRKVLNFKLMVTEIFVDIPDDLEEKWLVKLAPEGYRVLLITRNRNTYFYNHKCRRLFRLKTNFPGGGSNNIPGITVLDAIYNPPTKTVFVLDCLFWNSMQTLCSEASFRFYWLKTKFQEMPELAKSVDLKYSFVLIDSFPAERSLIQNKMFESCKIDDKELLYDGAVFYYVDSEYAFESSPLVTWLFSYMLPEKLGIDIPETYLKKQPEGYINLQHFIDNKEDFLKKKAKKQEELLQKKIEQEKIDAAKMET